MARREARSYIESVIDSWVANPAEYTKLGAMQFYFDRERDLERIVRDTRADADRLEAFSNLSAADRADALAKMREYAQEKEREREKCLEGVELVHVALAEERASRAV